MATTTKKRKTKRKMTRKNKKKNKKKNKNKNKNKNNETICIKKTKKRRSGIRRNNLLPNNMQTVTQKRNEYVLKTKKKKTKKKKNENEEKQKFLLYPSSSKTVQLTFLRFLKKCILLYCVSPAYVSQKTRPTASVVRILKTCAKHVAPSHPVHCVPA